MSIDPQVQMLLDRMTTRSLLSLNNISPAKIRRAYLVMQDLQSGRRELVNKVQDRNLLGLSGNIPVRIYTPFGYGPFPVLVYFHGGGFVVGSLETHDSFCRTLVNKVGCLVVSVDYRLAPEHKFPAAVNDAYATIYWIAINASEINGDPKCIAVGGDSAGGNLAAVAALMSRDRGGPQLIYQVLLYPIMDATQSHISYEIFKEGYLLSKNDMVWYLNQYLPVDIDRRHPYLSPLWAHNIKGLPPTLIITAEFDPLRDEGEAYARRLQSEGVPTTCLRYDGMIHGFCQMFRMLNKGQKAIEEIATALQLAFAS